MCLCVGGGGGVEFLGLGSHISCRLANNNQNVSASSSIAVSCLWLRFTTSLCCSGVGCDGFPWDFDCC